MKKLCLVVLPEGSRLVSKAKKVILNKKMYIMTIFKIIKIFKGKDQRQYFLREFRTHSTK